MSDRSRNLLQIRPQVLSATITASTCSEERFQNLSLRPIIKLQNPLLIAALRNYIGKYKNRFYELSLEKRLSYIENAVQRDIKFRNSLKGMVIGQFTVEEYECYLQSSSALNKRMMNMVIARYKDQIQLFEQPSLVQ
ncbi:MAG: glyoxalase [Maribacter sp.]|nr:glyoxalase [Maribacter sp.]